MVHVHTTLETQSEVGFGSFGEMSSTQTPPHNKQGDPSLTFCFSESQ